MPPKKKAPPPPPAKGKAKGKEAAPAAVSLVHLGDAQARLKQFMGSAVAKAIREKTGPMVFGSDKALEHRGRIPTGSLLLDLALDGGWIAGAFNSVYGKKGCGKTTAVLKAIAAAQKLCSLCLGRLEACVCGRKREFVAAFVDVEGTLDVGWAQVLGVDRSKILIKRPKSAEEALDLIEALVVGDPSNGVYPFDIIVVDSWAFLSPEAEIRKSVSDNTMGEQAKRIAIGIRKIGMAMNNAWNRGLVDPNSVKPTFFATNQVRIAIGLYASEITPGGASPGYAHSIEVRMKAKEVHVSETSKLVLWKDFEFDVPKNKTAVGRTVDGGFKLICRNDVMEGKMVGDYADEADFIDLLPTHGLVTGHGSSWTALGEKFGSKRDIVLRTVRDLEFRTRLFEATRAATSPTLVVGPKGPVTPVAEAKS